ncbi:hypothetical protein ACI1S1_01945, partial [Lactococcus garvieae]
LSNWFSGLDAEVRGMVQPVSVPDPAPTYRLVDAIWVDETGWLPANLASFPAAASDVTAVNSGGTAQAFALSFADVVRLSTPEGPFPNMRSRMGARNTWWVLRTGSGEGQSWLAHHGLRAGELTGFAITGNLYHGGVRPAIIVHQ